METPLKMEDIIPKTGQFTLAQTGKTYRLRPFSLADEVWLRQRYGDDAEITKMFAEIQMVKIAEIAFHQMMPEDQLEFVKQSVTLVDEEGNKKDIEVGGKDLLKLLIAGPLDKKNVLYALMETIGFSRSVSDKIGKDEAVKKKKSQSIGRE